MSNLQNELSKHPDRHFVHKLISGFCFGFDTGISTLPCVPFICKNNLSARKQPEIVSSLLSKELDNGFLIGPFSTPPFANYRINALGVAEHKFSKKQRLIVDMSAPHNNDLHPSINDLINKEEFSLSYVKLDDAIKILRKLGQGAWMCKFDVENAFKQCPILASHIPFHGVSWDNRFYFYTRLVFGSRSSCFLFNLLSDAVCWIAQNNYEVKYLLHLLDDFLTLDPPDAFADRTMAIMTMIFKQLGIPLSAHKTFGPTRCLEYLGIILDSLRMEARLPVDKLARLTDLLYQFQHKTECTKRELLSLLGYLNYCSRVVLSGRSFVSYLLTLSTTVRDLFDIVKLDTDCQRDIAMWSAYLREWNGVSFFVDDEQTLADDLQIFTDSSSLHGFAAIYGNQWCQGKWPSDLPKSKTKNFSMAFLELYPIVVAAILWGTSWKSKRIIFNCDNTATVCIVNKGRSSCPFIMQLMRRLTWCAAKGNFVIRACHLPGKKNLRADSLSRFNNTLFRQMAPHADSEPCPVPRLTDVLYI